MTGLLLKKKKKKKILINRYKGENYELIFCTCTFACAVTVPSNSCRSHCIILIKSDRGLELSKVLHSYNFCENRQPSRRVKYNLVIQCKGLYMSSSHIIRHESTPHKQEVQENRFHVSYYLTATTVVHLWPAGQHFSFCSAPPRRLTAKHVKCTDIS